MTPESALRIIFDNRNYAAETFLDDILTLSELAGSEAARKGFAALRGWDRKNNAQSRGALLFHQFWNKMVQTDLLKVPVSGNPELGSQLEMTSGSAPVIIEALETSVTELTDFGFSPDEPWEMPCIKPPIQLKFHCTAALIRKGFSMVKCRHR